MAAAKSTDRRPRGIYGVIDIGSSAIRIVIAEVLKSNAWHMVDSAFHPVSLGKDVFVSGSITRGTIVQCLQILSSYREMMAGLNVPEENVRVIATSALREASNRDTFIDRVVIRTGFNIQLVEGLEANHLTYLAVRQALRNSTPRFSQTNSIIMEVGGGSTEVMLLQHGKMVAAHTLHIGTVRMDQQLKSAFGTGHFLARFLHENIHTACDVLEEDLPLKRVRHFVAVGGDARIAANLIGEKISDSYWMIEKHDFDAFVETLQDLTTDDIVARYHIPYDEAEPLAPALLVYQQFMNATQAQRLTVPNCSIREGVLLTISSGKSDQVKEDFYSQVTASAQSLGRRYHVDEKHARQVAGLSLSLFSQLQTEHGMGTQHRLLLEVAALLHDVGSFVSPSSHHKHGQYIVANSDIFGLRPEEIEIISNVVRYHRRSLPNKSHASFMTLSREDRIVVMKLAALLRVADALDRGHRQRIRGVVVEQTPEELLLHADHDGDISLARFAVASKGDMFAEVFGLRVILL